VNIGVRSLGMLAVLVSLGGCDGGPGEAEFVEACLAQREMDEETCECAARESKAMMSAEAFAASVHDMRGERQQAEEITRSLPEDQQMGMIQQTLEVFERCIAIR